MNVQLIYQSGCNIPDEDLVKEITTVEWQHISQVTETCTTVSFQC